MPSYLARTLRTAIAASVFTVIAGVSLESASSVEFTPTRNLLVGSAFVATGVALIGSILAAIVYVIGDD